MKRRSRQARTAVPTVIIWRLPAIGWIAFSLMSCASAAAQNGVRELPEVGEPEARVASHNPYAYSDGQRDSRYAEASPFGPARPLGAPNESYPLFETTQSETTQSETTQSETTPSETTPRETTPRGRATARHASNFPQSTSNGDPSFGLYSSHVQQGETYTRPMPVARPTPQQFEPPPQFPYPQPSRPYDANELGLQSLPGPREGKAEYTSGQQQFWNQFPTAPPSHQLPARQTSLWTFLHQGALYGRVELAVWEPHFSDNRGFNIYSGPLTTSESWAFGFEATPRYVFGFESNAGTGLELEYWQFNEFSDGLQFTNDGFSTAVVGLVPNNLAEELSLCTTCAGQQINSRHHLTVNSGSLSFFKAYPLACSNIRGTLGLRYTSIDHELIANRNDGVSLYNNLNFQGAGPHAALDYFWPVGRTSLNLVGGLGLSLLFGNREQSVFKCGTLRYREPATSSPVSVFQTDIGLEWRRKVANCQSLLIRTTLESQYFLNGGSAVSADSDFGLYGLVFSAGWTR